MTYLLTYYTKLYIITTMYFAMLRTLKKVDSLRIHKEWILE